MKNKKGFTLIELLAVIVILGVLLLIAIPSVTSYITSSRKTSFINNAKSMVKGATVDVNSAKYNMFDTNTTYYIPASCISKETGGQSAFGGDWKTEYVVVTYNGDSFDYYYTALDTNKVGIKLIYNDLLAEKYIESGLDEVPINVTVGDREKIWYFDESCDPDVYRETYNVRHLIKDRDIYDENTVTQMFQLHGYCNFFGKNGVITGDGCADYNGDKFINTGLQLFSERNATRDFEISFNIERMSPAEQDPGVTQASLMACKLEKGEYPGFVFRFATNQLEFTQKINGVKKIINARPGEIKSVKIVRKDQVLYYAINGEQLAVFQDTHNFRDYFDSTLYLGAAQDGNMNPFRFINASISNLVVRMGDINFIGIEDNLNTVFHIDGECTFNGKDSNITGAGCAAYSNQKYIDTGINLYSKENINKDYEISFNIVNYNPNGQDSGTTQNTLVSNKKEGSSGQGLAFRRMDDKFEITQTLAGSKASTNEKANGIRNVKIYRKKGIVYYMYNDGTLKKLQDKKDVTSFINETLWFGAAPDTSGVPFRYLKATLSDITVKMSDK